MFVSAAREEIITDRVWGAPELVLEVLSPKPRLGTLQERLEWFAAYGVRECWLYHQFDRELEVIQFANAALTKRRTFGFHDRIGSVILRTFDLSCAAILTTYEGG